MNEEILNLLDQRISQIAHAVFHELIERQRVKLDCADDKSAKLREQLTFIKAKEHITVREAALLMSCSDSHSQACDARSQKKNRPAHPICRAGGNDCVPTR